MIKSSSLVRITKIQSGLRRLGDFGRQLPVLLPLLAAFSVHANAQEEPLRVTFLSPNSSDNLFWGQVMRFMEAVATDLEIEFNIVVSPSGSDLIAKRSALKIIERENNPDYIVTIYWGGIMDDIFAAGRIHDVKFFTFNTGLSDEDQSLGIVPRKKHPNWIGNMGPDDREAGYRLAEVLFSQAKAAGTNGGASKLQVAALSGDELSSVSAKRVAGFKQRADEDPQIHLNQIYNTNWSRDSGDTATRKLLDRYPDTSVIWTVADTLALGAIQIANTRKVKSRSLSIGGFDWSDEGVAAIKRGDMTASMGGHFVEGGWALALIYDYHHGYDFADDTGVSIDTHMDAITPENVDQHSSLLGKRNWDQVDFSKYSKTRNDQLKKYDFSLNTLLSKLH